jgi:hypothetical protein
LLAEAFAADSEEQPGCCEGKDCERCPCSGAEVAAEAPACAISDCDQARCSSACEEQEECEVSDTPTSARIEHLKQAAEHLAAAGLTEEADEIQRCAESLRSKLLEEKLAELQRLQAEIRQLQGESAARDTNQHVAIHVEIVELSLTKLRELGFDVQTLDPRKGAVAKRGGDRPRVTLQVYDRPEIAQLFEAFRRENILKVLASPTLVTADRRPVSFTSGGEIPAPMAQPDKANSMHLRSVGTKVDALPVLLGGDRVRLEIRPRYCEVDPTLSVKAADGSTVPGFRVHEVDTGCEMRLGQTAVIGGQIQERISRVGHSESGEPRVVRNEVQTLFLVTPQLVETLPAPPATSAAAPHGTPQ